MSTRVEEGIDIRMGSERFTWREKGASLIAIVLAMGVVMVAVGLAMLFLTDEEIKDARLEQARLDGDWTIRAAVKLTEESWRKYVGVKYISYNNYEGTVYNAVDKYSREGSLLWAIDKADDTYPPSQQYSLLPLMYERLGRDINTDDDLEPGADPVPEEYVYQVKLKDDTSDGANEGIVAKNAGDADVWNEIDGRHSFKAVITVTPDGAPHYSSNNVFFVFPIKYKLELTARIRNGNTTISETITGFGSLAFHIYRRSFAEYVMFCDEFNPSFPIMRGFTYDGPVHTNTSFVFSNFPSSEARACFTDYVSQVGATASGEQYPIFEKQFLKNQKEIPPPADLGEIKGGLGKEGGVLQGRAEPTEEGVYLPLADPADPLNKTLTKGGVFIKGDVQSLTMSQGDHRQTYTITQKLTTPIRDTSTPDVITYYSKNDCTGTILSPPPDPPTGSRGKKVDEKTLVTDGYIYTITTDYSTGTGKTLWRKEAIQYVETVTKKYKRSSDSGSWTLYSTGSPVKGSSTYVTVETDEYTGIITINDDPSISQAAFYVDGQLGVTGSNPTGLSGQVDKDTQVTVCAKGKLVISGDISYESDNIDDKNLMGILSEYGNVEVDYPSNTHVNISAAIMAPNGIFTATDYMTTHDSYQLVMTITGGVVQKGYGAVYPRYERDFHYDRRLKTQSPPLYPKQAACRMQTENQNNQDTIQLVWKY